MEAVNHNSRKFLFWQKWLYYTSLLFALFGLVLAFFGNNAIFRPYHRMLAQLFYNQNMFPDSTQTFYTFILGPMGATIFVCYFLLACIAQYPFRKKERWARNAIVAGFGIWYFTDALVSIYYGAYFHTFVIHLLVSVPQKALPIIFTWNEFKK
ncbi:MAG TPA: hypothetical protein VFD91_06765 [Mariniphaga sp.]|nr:hypothetical protein [Mariniphaga sp.]